MPSKIIFTEEQTQHIIDSYNNNVNILDIQKEMNCSEGVIYRVLKENNISRKRVIPPKISDEYYDEIKNMLENGCSNSELCAKFKVSKSVLWKTLKRMDLLSTHYNPVIVQEKIKCFQKNSEKPGRFDETILDNINTPDKAYCVGLFMADGCNLYEKSTFSIELQARDVDVLNKIKIMFQSDYELKFNDSKESRNRKQDTYVFRVTSRHFCERLNEIGVVPRKSLVLRFPKGVPYELIPFMFRGYIDGDGWVQRYRIGFMSAIGFCQGAQEYLNNIGIDCTIRDMKRHYDARTKTFDINGRNNILPLVELMYSTGNIYLERKYQKCVEFGFLKE